MNLDKSEDENDKYMYGYIMNEFYYDLEQDYVNNNNSSYDLDKIKNIGT